MYRNIHDSRAPNRPRTSSLTFNAVEVAKVEPGSWAQRMRIRSAAGGLRRCYGEGLGKSKIYRNIHIYIYIYIYTYIFIKNDERVGNDSRLVGGDWNMTFIFPYIGKFIIPIDIFQRGSEKPPTRRVRYV